MQPKSHLYLGKNPRGETETIYKTKTGRKILKKQLPNGRWITIL